VQATVNVEPSGQKPSADVEKMLAEAGLLAEAKQPLESLKAADQSLEAARQTNDAAGAALAQQARARALQDLRRTDEALTAWEEAGKIWAVVGQNPEQITALVQAGLLCVSAKKSEAERLFAQGLSVGKSETQRPGGVAQSLLDSGIALFRGSVRGFGKPIDKAQRQMALDYLSAALAIREQHTPESLPLVETLNALAGQTLDRGIGMQDPRDYAVAKDYATRAVEIGQRLVPDSATMVASLRALAGSEYALSVGDANIRLHYLAALRIQKKLAPAGSVEEVDILGRLGGLENDLTNYPAAREYLVAAVAMGERVAPDSLPFEYGLESLGVLEVNEGDPSAARYHLEKALAFREKMHASLGNTLLDLGAAVSDQGDFASARDYFERALSSFQETTPNSPQIPLTLDNLAIAFDRQGDLKSALEYSRRALAITEHQDPASLDTARNLGTVGDVLRHQGNFGDAADYYQRALTIWEKKVPESIDVAYNLNGLAGLARAQGNISQAMEYDRRALECGQKSCPDSWCVVDIINDLGELAYEQGDLATSESYLRRAMDIREKSLGPVHPLLASTLNDLALTGAVQGRTSEALADALRAEIIGVEHLRLSVRTLSERQSLAYEGIRASGLDLALSLTASRANTPSARGEVFDAVIRSRALVFDELAARHRIAYAIGDPEVRQLADQLSSARTRLATLVLRGTGDAPPAEYRNLLDDAREKKEKAERTLAGKSIAFRREEERAQLGLKEILASLPKGAALVAFVRYARYDLQTPGANKLALKPVPSYAAFVLRAGKNEPEFVQLGTAHEIESLLAAWRRDIARQAEVIDISAKTSDNPHRRFGAALRRKIWDPLLPELGDAREVFIVPDAALHLLNLASLPVGTSQYLIETGPLIYYLSTERDLVPAESRHGEGILIVGNPAFDQTGKLLVASKDQPVPTTAMSAKPSTILRGSRSACGTFQSLRFPPLPASQQEAENVAALWKKSTSVGGSGINAVAVAQPASGELLQMTGADASPEAFEQNAPGKRVLHVATHGFFLEGNCDSAMQRQSNTNTQDANFLPATAENPLLLSGLAFAGANRRASAKPDQTDGILTAEEIAGINLEGVDWAVLSACDTGVGEIKIGEGVFGLRRAFQVAGARTVIMSLWQVEDETTRQWMATLYREHFLTGKDTGESVRAASLQILRQRRTKHQSTHPFYWGAFIAAGDWH
jgi:CHAT domain-containing protein/tetratricopeptide (TPR) repeat protein